MSNCFQIILKDLFNTTSENSMEFPIPYNKDDIFSNKFYSARRALKRSKRANNHILQLVNAYYLGKLLECDAENNLQRELYARQLSQHYYIISFRTYGLFEFLGVQ